MQVTFCDKFQAWSQCLLSTDALLKDCEGFSLRLHDAICRHVEGELSLYELLVTYNECVQTKGLLRAVKRAGRWKAHMYLGLTLWPTRCRYKLIADLTEFLRVADNIFERDGFDAMKFWMEAQVVDY